MTLVAPVYLFALIPWAGVVLWVLRNQRERIVVPFARLWQTSEPQKRSRKGMARPPIWVAALLGACLFAILAAAGPEVSGRDSGITSLTVVVDRGLEMSGVVRGERGYVLAAEDAKKVIDRISAEANVDMRVMPEDSGATVADWFQRIKKIAPTGVNDPASVIQAARRALAETNGPVVLLSDVNLSVNDPRIAQFGVPGSGDHVGITALSARAQPTPQAMVTLLNESDSSTASVGLKYDDESLAKTVTLPPRGQSRNYFFDLPDAPKVLQAVVDSGGVSLDQEAWCVRRTPWPVVEARSDLPDELKRMIDVYTRNRPAGEDSLRIGVAEGSGGVPADSCAIVVGAGMATHPLAREGALTVAAGPLAISTIDWAAVLADAHAGDLPGEGWTAVVTKAGRVVVAVREAPARQVWVGFVSPTFARMSDYVVFWNAVFEWLGGGADIYGWDDVGRLDADWSRIDPEDRVASTDQGLQPGLYRRKDGRLRAVDSFAVKFPDLPGKWDGEDKLTAFARRQRQSCGNLAGPLIWMALAMLILAAMSVSAGRKSGAKRDSAHAVETGNP